MNLQQLEYIIGVDTYRHFSKAAQHCFVTQATLSMMISKLEDELDIKIFDRSRQPVIPTDEGKLLIAQAKVILQEVKRMKEIVNTQKAEVTGELKIGIIPTLAPYLLPLFVDSLLKKYPALKLKISELTTDEIVNKLQQLTLDAGILATPLLNPSLNEIPLFYEPFVVYLSNGEKPLLKKSYLLAEDIDVNRLWLLQEGHCLRSQVINLCELKIKEKELHQLDFETGSIETLKKIVESRQGITILPHLAVRDMSRKQKENIRHFKAPAPVREISIVTYRNAIKQHLIKILKEEILLNIPAEMKSSGSGAVVGI